MAFLFWFSKQILGRVVVVEKTIGLIEIPSLGEWCFFVSVFADLFFDVKKSQSPGL